MTPDELEEIFDEHLTQGSEAWIELYSALRKLIALDQLTRDDLVKTYERLTYEQHAITMGAYDQ